MIQPPIGMEPLGNFFYQNANWAAKTAGKRGAMKKILCLLLGAIVLALSDANATSTINSTNAYAWAANLGWTNWRPSAADGVVIGEFICSG